MTVSRPYLRSDGRMHVIRYENGLKRTQSYPRFLMEQHLGRELLSEEHVDHIDGDFTNNAISNLQILSQAENNRKSFIETGRQAKMISCVCPTCGIEFEKPLRVVKSNRKQGKVGPFCSKRCVGLVFH